MTLEAQREHILSGRMDDDLTDELRQARQRAVLLTTGYNDSFGRPQEEREAILRRLLRSVGAGCHFEPTFRCESGFNISTIVASGGVVTPSLPAGVVAAGVPARVVREITDADRTGHLA